MRVLIADDDPRETYEDMMECTAVGWLRKPYGMSELLTQLTSHVQSFRLPNGDYIASKRTAYQGVGQ